MSSSKVKQQVRPVQKVKLINKVAQAETGVSSRAMGIIPVYELTADLPAPASLPEGCLVFDKEEFILKINIDNAWEEVD